MARAKNFKTRNCKKRRKNLKRKNGKSCPSAHSRHRTKTKWNFAAPPRKFKCLVGNKIARTTQVSATEYYLHDLPSSYNLVLKEVLGQGRFFKSIQCKHDEGLVLVKVYFKRGDSIHLHECKRRLALIKETFLSLDYPHVWPFQLLIAAKQCLDKGICNTFKPTYIPYDEPSDFSFFFDTGGRRLCYLAPEVLRSLTVLAVLPSFVITLVALSFINLM